LSSIARRSISAGTAISRAAPSLGAVPCWSPYGSGARTSVNTTAGIVAERLEKHPRIKKVNYPGLASFAGNPLARRQMSGFGGMISFVLDGDASATACVVDKLRIFSIGASLGGVESLVTQPLTTTHHGLTAQERSRRGIVDGMVRISCGLEDVEDLWSDLAQALA